MKNKIPSPRRYLLKYRKANRQIDDYEISLPIEAKKDSFSAYCFNRRGIRQFKNDSVMNIREIAIVADVRV